MALFLVGAQQGRAAHMTLIAANSHWRFLDDGSDQDSAWRFPEFNDRQWKMGRGKFGYGDNSETTLVGDGDSTAGVHITTYFRRPVYVPDPDKFSELTMKVQHDDGAVVYANGVEVMRVNMPTGAITAGTQAIAATSNEEGFTTSTLDGSALHRGTNVFAVEVHQFDPTSSDMGFNFELVGVTPDPIGEDQMTFAVIGDYGEDSVQEQRMANMVKSWNPEFIATVGDNNYPAGSATTIDANIGKHFHDFIYEYKGIHGAGAEQLRFLPAPGNHDYYSTPPLGPYLDYFTLPGNERYYDYRIGPIHVFALNSVEAEPDGFTSTSKQANWLHTKLIASDAPWKMVLLHYPPYCSGGDHGSSPALRWPFREWGADAVFAGHDHLYERMAVDGLPYFVNGTGARHLYALKAQIPGSIFRDNREFGAQRGVVSSEFLLLEYYWIDGQLLDTFSIHRPQSPWKIDGFLEADVPPADDDALKIYAQRQGDWLYLATTSFSGSDHFLYLARQPGAPVAANWKKSGAIAQWDFFLAKERDSEEHGWYDAHEYPTNEEPGFWSAARDGRDGLLEGAINLKVIYGEVPPEVYVAVGSYETEDGGALNPDAQVPQPISSDGNLDADEYLRLPLASDRGTNWIAF
ncbi:metallophosphoesterase [Candidatus Sumerlaeota bacterium]|nr:metallophosphoesterase [Candidatus Sumerlaeota bacterium]